MVLSRGLWDLRSMCARRLLLAAELPDLYWSYAMRFAAERLRHKALGFPWHVPGFGEEAGAFGEEVSMWQQLTHGVVVPVFLLLRDLQDPELVHGLQPKTVAVERLRLSHPRITPDGWTKEAVKEFSIRWQTIRTPEGKDLWLKMDTGQTQYLSPFVSEVKDEATVPAEEPIAYGGEATDPGNAVFRPEVVVFQPFADSLYKPEILSPRPFRKPELYLIA